MAAIGQIVELEGSVQVLTANGVVRQVRVGDWLEEGDQILTGAGARIQVRYVDGSSRDYGLQDTETTEQVPDRNEFSQEYAEVINAIDQGLLTTDELLLVAVGGIAGVDTRGTTAENNSSESDSGSQGAAFERQDTDAEVDTQGTNVFQRSGEGAQVDTQNTSIFERSGEEGDVDTRPTSTFESSDDSASVDTRNVNTEGSVQEDTAIDNGPGVETRATGTENPVVQGDTPNQPSPEPAPVVTPPQVAQISISGPDTVLEGQTTNPYTLTLDVAPAAVTGAIRVQLAYKGTATDGTDYDGIASVIIPPGSNVVSFSLDTLADNRIESPETIELSILSVQEVGFLDISINPDMGSVETQIVDATSQFSVGDVSISEGGLMTFTVSRSGDSSSSQTVRFATGIQANNNAEVNDFTPASGRLTFAEGVTSQTFSVQTRQDGRYEGAETFTVTLSNNSTGSVITDGTATGTILDNGTGPGPFAPGPGADNDTTAFSIGDASVTEGGVLTFTVTRTGDAEASQTVNFSTAIRSGNSASISDFTAVNGTLTFAPGVTSQTFSVQTVADSLFEGTETFSVVLSNNSAGSSIADGLALATINESLSVAKFTDNFVNGVSYRTSSGVTGLTGDAGGAGTFAYKAGDTITFTVGDVVIGVFSADVVQNGLLFLQDIAGTELSDNNSMYVENMAIFLQALDNDLQDSNASDGVLRTSDLQNVDASYASNINISQAMRDAFTGYVDPTTGTALNIASSGKEMISQALAHVGIEFVRDEERDGSGNNIFETIAMDHVAGTIQELAGDRAPDAPDARSVDVLEVPGAEIRYNYSDIDGEITFSTDDLLVGAVANQVVFDNLLVTNVRLSAGYESVGTIEDRGNGNFAIVLNAGVDQYDLEGLSIDYRVEDWTVFRDVTSDSLDTNKAHLSADIPDVPEDVGFHQFTLNSSLTFDTDSELNIDFTSELLSASLGYPVAEYADDYLVPIEYSNDGGLTWHTMEQSGIIYNELGVPRPVFGFILGAGDSSVEIRVPIFDDVLIEDPIEYFDALVFGDNVYDEHVQFGIIDNDTTAPSVPQISINFIYVVENQGEAIFTVSLSSASVDTITVDYNVDDLAAIAGEDFVATSGTLTFNPGETTATISVPLIDDLIIESMPNPELAVVSLSNPVNAVIADAQGTLRIFDDDGPANVAISITTDPVTPDNVIEAAERDDTITLSGTVTMNGLTTGLVTVTVNGQEYYARTQSDGTFSVDVAATELIADADHTFDARVDAYNPDGDRGTATAQQPYSVVLGAVVSLTGPATVVESATTTDYTLTIDNAVPLGNSVTVNLVYSGVAADGTDFTGVASVDITGGNSSATFTIDTLDDVYAEGPESLIVTIDSLVDNDGSYDAVSAHVTNNQVTTTITDDTDTTTLSLDATANVTESGTVTYTATLTSPADGPVTLTLSNGETITIADGDTTGTVDVLAGDDVYLGGGSLSVTITGANGGGFEDLVVDGTSADTTITDDTDTTTATLSVDQTSIDEDGATLRYTVTLDNATDTAMTVTLSNGEDITIGAGDTSGFVDVVIAADSDVFAEADTSIDVSIASTAGGNFEDLDIATNGSVSTTVSDSTDTVTVSLTATASTSEDGGSITYTATLSGGDVSAHDGVSVTLDNGETINIAAGATSGTTTVAVNQDDVFAETDSISNHITAVSETTSGQFEDLAFDNTPVLTTITDDSDTVTVSLTATASTSEDGGSITYTATLSGGDVSAHDGVSVTLDNGETINIAAGATSGTTTVAVNQDDVFAETDSISNHITAVSETTSGQFEDLAFDNTPVLTTITDDTDTVTVSLSATASTSEDGGSITYTATLSGGDVSAHEGVSVTLDNGETINIAAGAASGTTTIAVNQDDVFAETDSISNHITAVSETTSGQFEDLDFDATPVSTTITDDSDTTTATLSVDQTSIDEDGATLRYTVTLDNATDTAMTVTLSNGEDITIGAGDTSGFVDVVIAADSDVFAEVDTSIDVSIASTSGGNFEDLDTTTNGSVSTTVSDSTDTVTVSLTATASTSEDGGSITYTATLSGGDVSAHDGVSVTLDNGETINIAAGDTTGTVTIAVNQDDPHVETDSISNHITAVSETTSGQFEDLAFDNTPVSTTIADDTDTTTATLSVDQTSIDEDGATLRYTVTLDNATDTAMTLTLSNGEDITIGAGDTSGFVDVVIAADSDVFAEADTSIDVSIASTSGGNFEDLDTTTNGSVSTTVSDSTDTVTVSLTATASTSEDGGSITYTATLSGGDVSAHDGVSVTLDNGETITIAAGDTSGTTTIAVNRDDVFAETDSISNHITAVSETTSGQFEDLTFDNTPVSTTIADDTDTVTVSLSTTASTSEDGGSITYTATLSGGDVSAHDGVSVTLDNGETITIAAGDTSGTTTIAVNQDDVFAETDSISNHITAVSETTSGQFEDLDFDATPVSTTIADDTDTVTVSLTATASTPEDGGSITYTATLSGGDVSAHDGVSVTLDNGETINIAAGDTSGTTTIAVNRDDVFAETDSISNHITAVSETTLGQFEDLDFDNTPVSTTITDDSDTVTVSLSATASTSEDGGSITYTATLSGGDVSAHDGVSVTLDNGETINIAAGATSGTTTIAVNLDDVFAETDSISNHITAVSETTSGQFEDLDFDATPVSTTITDDTDTVTVSLSATASTSEEGGSITYTATLSGGDVSAHDGVSVTLDNGETINIAAGATSGTTTIAVNQDDVFAETDSISNHITAVSETTSGQFEDLAFDNTPVSTTITDDSDTVTVSLTATASTTEDGGSITYTASLSGGDVSAHDGVSVTLDNGETINIAAGDSTGTVTVAVNQDDVFAETDSISNHITAVSETTSGQFEDLDFDATPVSTTIADDADTVTVSLSATVSTSEDGGSITYTATLSGGDVSAHDGVSVTLDNGETINIAAGATSGTTTVAVNQDDVFTETDSISNHITGVSETSSGQFEDLAFDNTPVSTTITDDSDTVTVSLTATASTTEDGGSITYTATLSGGDVSAHDGVSVTLDNGETINIAAGATSGTTTVAVNQDDVFTETDSISNHITGVSETTSGQFEDLDFDNTPVSTTIADDTDTVTVSLTATASTSEDGGSITYTATLSGGDVSAHDGVSVTLDNGETINIAAGAASGTTTIAVNQDDVFAETDSISNHITAVSETTSGQFEDLDFDNTPVSTTIADDIDTVTLSLTATASTSEDGGSITYTATLSGGDVSAHDGVSVTLDNGETINIAAGDTTGTVTVAVNQDDTLVETDSISNHITAVSETTSGQFEDLDFDNTPVSTTITDDTDAALVSISGPASVVEGETTATYTVSVDTAVPAGNSITVNLVYSGTATDGTDFTGVASVTITGGNSSATFTLDTTDDLFAEGAESIVVDIDSIVDTDGSYEAIA